MNKYEHSWTHLALRVCAVGDQAALQDGPGAVQQRAELSLREEPPQHLLPGPRAEPPTGTEVICTTTTTQTVSRYN